MALRCIISDIDGCLGPESHGPLDAPTLARIAGMNQRSHEAGGPIITLCSGRPLPYAEAMSRLIGNAWCPIVCEMGVWLYDPRTNGFLMDPAITREHLGSVEACRGFVREELGPKGVVMQPGKAASISLWHPETSWLMGLKGMLEERIKREGWPLRVSSTVAWINLDLTHVSKATGIARLKAMMEYARDDLAGIGDTMGDMAIREHVAWFACPSNADPRLRAHADFVAESEEASGVVQILQQLGMQ